MDENGFKYFNICMSISQWNTFLTQGCHLQFERHLLWAFISTHHSEHLKNVYSDYGCSHKYATVILNVIIFQLTFHALCSTQDPCTECNMPFTFVHNQIPSIAVGRLVKNDEWLSDNSSISSLDNWILCTLLNGKKCSDRMKTLRESICFHDAVSSRLPSYVKCTWLPPWKELQRVKLMAIEFKLIIFKWLFLFCVIFLCPIPFVLYSSFAFILTVDSPFFSSPLP